MCLARSAPDGRWDLDGIALRAQGSGAGVKLDGEKTLVLDGASADVLLVVARSDAGLELLRVGATAAGLARSAIPPLDLTRKLARVRFARTPATRISSGGQTAKFERMLAFVCAALAAEQVGGAQRCLEMAPDYAKSRLQFGARSAATRASSTSAPGCSSRWRWRSRPRRTPCSSTNEPDFVEATALAKAYWSEAYFHAAADNIQIHGGMGFTWEAAPHVYASCHAALLLDLREALLDHLVAVAGGQLEHG